MTALLGALPQSAQERAAGMGLVLMMVVGLAGLAVVYRRSRFVQVGLYSALIVSMVILPLAQSVHAAGAYERLNDRVAAAQPAQTEAADPSTSAINPFNPNQDPLSSTATSPNQTNPQSLASTCVITATSDGDGDGLTDNVEIYELGTRIDQIDTDGDNISDKTEVTPFEVNGQAWYLDPLNPDSKGDGLTDGTECFGRTDVITTTLLTVLEDTCPDSDGDHIPDIHDFDDDGDGVPDSADLAPQDAQAVANQTFNLTIANAAADTNLFVDVQVRPKDERHLWWTNSVLNWPSGDTRGQIRRVTTDTLTTDGNMILIPMLEIAIPYSVTNPSGGCPSAAQCLRRPSPKPLPCPPGWTRPCRQNTRSMSPSAKMAIGWSMYP